MWRLDKKGFTLVEIMIVVAIIGLLAAIAIPNFVTARERAAEQACRANLRQLESAIQMFRIDTGAWPAGLADLTEYLRTVPTTCPGEGGAYTYVAASGTVSCADHTL